VESLNSNVMRAIAQITYGDAAKDDRKRENANIDGNTAMGMMLQYGSEVSKLFCHEHILGSEYSKRHRSGDIHIHDLDFMSMGTLTCCQIDLTQLFKGGFSTGHGFLREPNDIASYAALAAVVIQSNQNDQHGGQSIPFFDYALSDGIRKTFKKSYELHLGKAINLLTDLRSEQILAAINGWVQQVEQETGTALALQYAECYVRCEHARLVQLLHLNEHIARKVQQFAYQEAYAETDRKAFQAMEAFIHNLNTMHSRAGAQVPFSSINFGTDTSVEGRMVSRNLLLALEKGLGNGETAIFPIVIFKIKEGINFNVDDPNYDLLQLSCKVSAKRLFPNFSFIDAPFNAQYYRANRPETEVAYMGCRTRVLGNAAGDEVVSGRGNLSFTTINLPRLGIKHGLRNRNVEKLECFFSELDESIELVIGQLLERMTFQGRKKAKNFPFLMGQGIWRGSETLHAEDRIADVIKQGTLAVGFIGLAECLIALIGKHHGESEDAQQLGLRIVGHMRKRMDEASRTYGLNFSLIATPAEGLSGRFTAIDRNQFGAIPNITDREYYTNSYHVPVYYNVTAYEKINIEAPYHELCNGGHITYVELDGDPSHNLEAFEQIIREMKRAGIGYGSINHPVDRDPVCGYHGIIEGDRCPGCGRSEREEGVSFQRIRRITGYLVGSLERFNNAKRAEVHDRIKHN